MSDYAIMNMQRISTCCSHACGLLVEVLRLQLTCGKYSTGKSRKKHNYAGVMGLTVDIPAHVFAVDIPDLFYRGVVLKKDRAHTGMLCEHLCIPFHDMNELQVAKAVTATSLGNTW